MTHPTMTHTTMPDTAGGCIEFAPAKINLSLRVVGQRNDGYHLLDSLVVFADVGDHVHATPAPTLHLRITGSQAADLVADDNNLVLRAARAMQGCIGTRQGAALVLDKQLPVASGIGGGSADAAATIRLLQRLWPNAGAALPDLMGVAAALGADVPVCLAGRAARLGGIGDVLRPAPALPACWMVLVNPGYGVSTPAVFAARPAGFSAKAVMPDGWADAATLCRWLQDEPNDLQATACALCPAIQPVLAALQAQEGCLLARMSGSGATCFGLFGSQRAAQAALPRLAQQRQWWCRMAAMRTGLVAPLPA